MIRGTMMHDDAGRKRPAFRIDGALGELVVAFPCFLHGGHVVVGGGFPGSVSSPLHLHVDEALELVSVLNAGEAWQQLALQPDGYRQASMHIRCGLYGVTVKGETYYLSWKPQGLELVVVSLNAAGRGELAAAVLELAAGKIAAA